MPALKEKRPPLPRDPILDTEEVIDKVHRLLCKKALTILDLYHEFEFEVTKAQLDEALDILDEIRALNWRQEPVRGTLLPVYEVRRAYRRAE